MDNKPLLGHVVGLLKADLVSKDVSLSIIKLISRIFSDAQDSMDTGDNARSAALAQIVPELVGFFTAIVAKKSARGLDKEILQLVVYISVDIDDDKLCSQLSMIIIKQLKSKSSFLRMDLLKSLSKLLLKTSSDQYQARMSNFYFFNGTLVL